MIQSKCKCFLTNKEYDLVSKNRHCIQYFCVPDKIRCNDEEYNKPYDHIYFYTSDYDTKQFSIIPRSIKDFKRDNVFETLDDIKKLGQFYDYEPRKNMPSTVLHLGQVKLFLSTLQFLLYYAPKDEMVHVVYPGSAPGDNLLHIIKLFPQCVWYLIDPCAKWGFNKNLYTHPNVVYIKRSLFTDDICNFLTRKLKGKYVLLISDIRAEEEGWAVDRDNRLNEKWVRKMKPNYAQLKWKLRWDKPDSEYRYLDGKVYLQMYARENSTETRLVVDGKNIKTKIWKAKEYDGYMSHFNRVLRCSHYPSKVKVDCVDHCHDCVSMIKLIQKYKENYKENPESKQSISNMIKTLLSNIKHDKYTEHERLCNSLKKYDLKEVQP